MTYDEILQRMLDNVSNDVDKREGSIIYNALAPAAFELTQMYIERDIILNETFADTASRSFLIRRAAERGVIPKPASKAILKGVFNIDVPIGSRFSINSLIYTVIQKIADHENRLECETVGEVGNQNFGTLLPVEYIEGLTSAELTEVIIPGEEEEDTEVLRNRYFDSLDSQAFGGNVSDYKEKAMLLNGIGGVKVYPTWNGGGTVKLVIIDSSYCMPSTQLISEIQTAIDPVTNQGEGIGLAPIGHVVTVGGVGEETINITTNITYQDGWSWDDISNYVENKLDDYFIEIKKEWADQTNIIVRISQIESRLLDVSGIVDIANTTINGLAQNITLNADNIPVRGDINGG